MKGASSMVSIIRLSKKRERQTQEFLLEYEGRSIEVKLFYNKNRDEVQATSMMTIDGKINRWTNPSFVQLVEKYLGYQVPGGERKAFIRGIYFSK
jgi:UPF0288 family protein (methanogenesis marker protein 3)